MEGGLRGHLGGTRVIEVAPVPTPLNLRIVSLTMTLAEARAILAELGDGPLPEPLVVLRACLRHVLEAA